MVQSAAQCGPDVDDFFNAEAVAAGRVFFHDTTQGLAGWKCRGNRKQRAIAYQLEDLDDARVIQRGCHLGRGTQSAGDVGVGDDIRGEYAQRQLDVALSIHRREGDAQLARAETPPQRKAIG